MIICCIMFLLIILPCRKILLEKDTLSHNSNCKGHPSERHTSSDQALEHLPRDQKKAIILEPVHANRETVCDQVVS